MKGLFQILGFLIVAGALVASIFGIPLLGLWLLCVFVGAGGRAEKSKAIVAKVLMGDETVIGQSLQHRAFAFFHRRDAVVITTSRTILIKRGLLGGFKMADIQWKDLLDVTIDENILSGLFGSNLKFTHLNRSLPAISVDGIPSDPASKMYAAAQSEEQAWEEKRRVRAIEEVRAASGGVIVNTGSGGERGGGEMADEIAKAKVLFDQGAVSDSEFQEMKAKILARS
ncbi:MAG: SHOCT domain-containing protein [Phenylobacterium sp.]|uniref:SHOCT domain-containing protein n=1 Tax=Phenylobacterium sp. TaxID=1871053 RepID=UPI0027337792|nr:SHOCT domain-containing protein [Phenylobacterium sp.]MDP3173739.1 SHOCT domain-containing protein [Phenylobacterium sp.]